MKFIIEKEDTTKRIDQFITEHTDYSRSKVVKLIETGKVLVNGTPTKKNYTLKEEDQLEIGELEIISMEATAEKMDIPIVYEDEDIIIVDKPNGMVVHPAPGNYTGTLVNGLLYHSELSTCNGSFRPGIVHRIDADTTGLLVVAKNDKAHELLAKQLEEKTTHRKYIALVWGVLESDTGTIDAPIGRDTKDRKKMAIVANGKSAVTHFKVLERFKNATLIEVVLETGRTHQIRVHMNYIGHPVVNDPVYGKRKRFDETGQALHAAELGFIHPTTGKYMEFTSELPAIFLNVLENVKDL